MFMFYDFCWFNFLSVNIFNSLKVNFMHYAPCMNVESFIMVK